MDWADDTEAGTEQRRDGDQRAERREETGTAAEEVSSLTSDEMLIHSQPVHSEHARCHSGESAR